MHEDGSIDDDISSVVLFRLCVLLMFIAKSRRRTVKVETRDKEIMTKSTFGLNGNLKYPETTLKIRKMCGYFANPLENDMKFSPQTSFDFAHAQTLFSSVQQGRMEYLFLLNCFLLKYKSTGHFILM